MSLKINFFCEEKYRDRVPEPIPASKSFPKWFSELSFDNSKLKYRQDPNNIHNLIQNNDNFNVKKCLGIQDFLNTGYIIPSWGDFIFRESDSGELYINWMENYYDDTSYQPHPDFQYKTMPNKPVYGHFGKIFTPWVIKTDPGVSCLITHPFWHRNKSFTSTSAVMHTDNFGFRIPWFFEWNYKIESGMDLESMSIEDQVVGKGEPLVLIIPFYRKNYTSKVDYISSEKWNTLYLSQMNQTHDTMGGQCPYKNFRKTLGKLFG